MDLIDLFIGCEGTLGVVTAVTLRVLPVRPAMCLAFVPFALRAGALAFVRAGARRGTRDVARARSARTRRIGDRAHGRALPRTAPRGRRRSSVWRHHSGATEMALLVTLELPAGTSSARAYEEIGSAREPDAADTPLRRFCRAARRRRRPRRVEIAVPGDARGRRSCWPLREAVPAAVNPRVGRAKQTRRRADRENGGGHDRAVRSARRAAHGLRDRISALAASTPPSGATSRTATCIRT